MHGNWNGSVPKTGKKVPRCHIWKIKGTPLLENAFFIFEVLFKPWKALKLRGNKIFSFMQNFFLKKSCYTTVYLFDSIVQNHPVTREWNEADWSVINKTNQSSFFLCGWIPVPFGLSVNIFLIITGHFKCFSKWSLSNPKTHVALQLKVQSSASPLVLQPLYPLFYLMCAINTVLVKGPCLSPPVQWMPYIVVWFNLVIFLAMH